MSEGISLAMSQATSKNTRVEDFFFPSFSFSHDFFFPFLFFTKQLFLCHWYALLDMLTSLTSDFMLELETAAVAVHRRQIWLFFVTYVTICEVVMKSYRGSTLGSVRVTLSKLWAIKSKTGQNEGSSPPLSEMEGRSQHSYVSTLDQHLC